MVYEARGDNQKAADCYRKVINFIRARPDDYDPAFENEFVKRVDNVPQPVSDLQMAPSGTRPVSR
jgi:hypothetical protein